MNLVSLEAPPDEETIDFLQRTLDRLRADPDVAVAIVVTVLYRGRTYSIHTHGARESGVLAMVGTMEAAKAQLLKQLEEP